MCFSCVTAVEKKWCEDSGLMEHEKSQLHIDSFQRIATLGCTLISALLSDIAAKEQSTARNVLELFRCIRFLGQKGLPIQYMGQCTLWVHVQPVQSTKNTSFLSKKDLSAVLCSLFFNFADLSGFKARKLCQEHRNEPFMDWQLMEQLTWGQWKSLHATYST